MERVLLSGLGPDRLTGLEVAKAAPRLGQTAKSHQLKTSFLGLSKTL